jgi:hypothetical protein
MFYASIFPKEISKNIFPNGENSTPKNNNHCLG